MARTHTTARKSLSMAQHKHMQTDRAPSDLEGADVYGVVWAVRVDAGERLDGDGDQAMPLAREAPVHEIGGPNNIHASKPYDSARHLFAQLARSSTQHPPAPAPPLRHHHRRTGACALP